MSESAKSGRPVGRCLLDSCFERLYTVPRYLPTTRPQGRYIICPGWGEGFGVVSKQFMLCINDLRPTVGYSVVLCRLDHTIELGWSIHRMAFALIYVSAVKA